MQVEHVGNDYMAVSGYVMREEGVNGVGEEDRRVSCAHMAVLALRMAQEARVVVASSQGRLCLSVGIAAGPVVLDSHPSAFFHIDPPISPFPFSPSLPSPLGL